MRTTFRKRLFAWLLKKGDSFNDALYGSFKLNLFHDLKGMVVEIGPGTGVNFNYFPAGIKWSGIEPNEAFHNVLLAKAQAKNIHATLLAGDATQIPLPDNQADVMLCTLVLCSVDDPVKAIAEMKRVLKPGGKLIFIEHVAAPENTLLWRVQHMLNPVNRFAADGCNCNRLTGNYLEQAGFDRIEMSRVRVQGALKIHSPHIMGYAIK